MAQFLNVTAYSSVHPELQLIFNVTVALTIALAGGLLKNALRQTPSEGYHPSSAISWRESSSARSRRDPSAIVRRSPRSLQPASSFCCSRWAHTHIKAIQERADEIVGVRSTAANSTENATA
jgi:hypothetical protein